MLYKQMQKANAHLPTGTREQNNYNITFFHFKNTCMFALFRLMLHFTAFLLTFFLHNPLNIAYYSMKCQTTYSINMFYK